MSVSPFVWAYVLQLSERNSFSRTPEHVPDALGAAVRTQTHGLGFWASQGDSGPVSVERNSNDEQRR